MSDRDNLSGNLVGSGFRLGSGLGQGEADESGA